MKSTKFLVMAAATLILAGCESTKKDLGLIREAPDEFTVVKRAPLELPPDFTLRPPQPGAQRPQEALAAEEARAAVFGSDAAKEAQAAAAVAANGEAALLIQAGAQGVNPSIRQQVDAETAKLEPREKPVAERLLGWGSGAAAEPATSVVDAKAEAERLKTNRETGKPVTEGETPSVEQ